MERPFSVYTNGYIWGKARDLPQANLLAQSISLQKYQTALVVHDATDSVCNIYWMDSSGRLHQVFTKAARAWNEPDDTIQHSAE